MNETATAERRPQVFRVIARLMLASACGLAFGFTIYVFLLSLVSGNALGARDFVARWATARLMVQHANPYDATALVKIEQAAGFPVHYGVMYMLNPPWTLPLVYPLGFLGLQAASILWGILQLVFLAGSVYMLWIMHGRPNNRRSLLGYSFAPALICLIMGQLTLLALVGLVLFLRLYRTRPFWAGVSLWLCMLKPHLFLPFGVVLLAWVIITKTYRLLAGAISSVIATCTLAFLITPIHWSDYFEVLRRPGPQWEFVPCASVLLRVWISKNTAGLNYIPSVLGCIWGLAYFWPRRATWDWSRDGSLLMLVSILVAPYTWLYDQALAIPALLQGAYVTRSRNMLIALALLSVLIETALLGIVWRPTTLYIWTLWSAPAWVVWYLIATVKERRQEKEDADPEALAY